MRNAAARPVRSSPLWLWIIGWAVCIGPAAFFDRNSIAADVEAGQTPEQITATALLNICRYVEWPEAVFVTKGSPIVFGIYGATPISREIERQGKDWRANGRRIFVRQFSWPAIPNCNMLFIASTEKVRLGAILQKVEHAPVLTVSESEGCMVRLLMQDGKPRFQFNMVAVTNAHLKPSSQLKNVADVNWVENREEIPKPSKADPPVKKPFRMKNAE